MLNNLDIHQKLPHNVFFCYISLVKKIFIKQMYKQNTYVLSSVVYLEVVDTDCPVTLCAVGQNF